MTFGLLAVVAATLAALLVYSALKRREAEVQRAVANTVEIAVAEHDLPLGSKIQQASIKMVRWPRDSLPPGAVTDPQTVLNSTVTDDFVQNEPIVMTKLFAGERKPGILPLFIPPGMRAMSVPVDEVSGVAGFILPRSRVDVLVSIAPSGLKPFSKVVLQNIEVLAVEQEIEPAREGKDTPQVAKVVTLLVTPGEAERLALANHEGALRLALRNYTDDKIVTTSGSDIDTMLRGYGGFTLPIAQTPAAPGAARGPAVAAPLEVEIMRDGTRREVISFIKGSRAQAFLSSAPVAGGPAPAPAETGAPNPEGMPPNGGAAAPGTEPMPGYGSPTYGPPMSGLMDPPANAGSAPATSPPATGPKVVNVP